LSGTLNTRIEGTTKSERDNFIKKNMPLVGFVTARFIGRGYDYDDLYQYGCIGLIKAADRYDPDYGVTFSTYAVPLIIGEIKRFIRGDGSVHVSRTIRENAVKLIQALDNAEMNGDHVTIDFLCNVTGLTKQEAVLAMSALTPVKSLSEPVSGEGEILLQDVLGNDEGENITDHIALGQAMASLSEEEQNIIARRYYHRHTQTLIANEMGLTQVQISRMEKRILQKLRTYLT